MPKPLQVGGKGGGYEDVTRQGRVCMRLDGVENELTTWRVESVAVVSGRKTRDVSEVATPILSVLDYWKVSVCKSPARGTPHARTSWHGGWQSPSHPTELAWVELVQNTAKPHILDATSFPTARFFSPSVTDRHQSAAVLGGCTPSSQLPNRAYLYGALMSIDNLRYWTLVR